MAPSVAAITANTGLRVNGVLDTTGYAGGTVTVTAADATNPRRDIIWYDGAGAVGVTAGTPAAAPALPTLTAGRIAIYEVYIAANDTSIDAGDLIDRRQPVGSPALAMPEFLNPLVPFDNTGLAASVMIANQAYLIPIVPLTANVTLAGLLMRIGTQSGNIDWGIYSTTDDVTWTRVASAGLTACPGPSSATLLALTPALTAGTRYYFAFACDNGTATFGNYGNGGSGSIMSENAARTKAASFPLPASITAAATIQTLIPSIIGRLNGGLVV